MKISVWVEKKKRNTFSSIFGEWNKRLLVCGGDVLSIYRDPTEPSHTIPLTDIRSIEPTESFEQDPADPNAELLVRIDTRLRSFLFRFKTIKERDMMIPFLTKSIHKINCEHQHRIKEAKEDLNRYFASLQMDSILSSLKRQNTNPD